MQLKGSVKGREKGIQEARKKAMIEFGLIAQKYWKLFNKSSQNWLIQVWLNKGAIPYPEQKRITEIRVMLGTGDRKLIIN